MICFVVCLYVCACVCACVEMNPPLPYSKVPNIGTNSWWAFRELKESQYTFTDFFV